MALPQNFAGFFGNTRVVNDLRAAIAAARFPHALILSGARNSGKYTLALLLTLAVECDLQPRDQETSGRMLAGFCGHCRNCVRVAAAGNLEEQIASAVSARDEMRETDKKETRVLVQTHPDVLIVPPDPPQNLIKVGQIRTVIGRAQYLPTEAPARVFVFTSASFMKEAANSLLKLLEEPPSRTHLVLLADNPGELLPTIRSRCMVARLGAISHDEIVRILADQRPELKRSEAELVARLAEGAAGRALSLDLQSYTAARNDAFTLLSSAGFSHDHTALFRLTEGYRAGTEGQEKTQALLRGITGLLEDLLFLQAGAGDRIRNVDCRADLERLAANFTFDSLERALKGVDDVYAGMRRNLLRSLSLDAFALGLR